MIARLSAIVFVALLCVHQWGRAQNLESYSLDTVLELPDTVQPFSIDEFYSIIFANHPVVKQAALLEETARQEIRLARGAFDPKIESNWDIKHFKDNEYFNTLNTSLKVATWFPIDPKIDVDRNRGVFLNPESSIPDDWQITTGINLTLGKGLIIDERRATVKQAVLFQEILEAEQIKMINKILLQSSKDYWDWYFSYYNFLIFQQSVDIAQEIFNRVRLNYQYGEAAVVDTVQAQITLQNRTIEMQEALLNFLYSGFVLSNHLWGENEEPLELSESTAPIDSDSVLLVPNRKDLEVLKSLARTNHPELVKLTTKGEQLAVENRLNRENLKPQVDLSYGLIDRPFSANGETQEFTFEDNYKLGMTFSFPLFLRKERAKVQKTNLKILENQYQINLTKRQIQNEINGAYALLLNTTQVIEQQTLAVDNYRRLLQAELLNLQNGESDLFRINFQQDKLIQSQSKLLKLRAEYEKARVTLYWAAGIENLNLSQ